MLLVPIIFPFLILQTLMNVAVIHVKMVEHVLISSMAIHVPVLLDTVELFVKQVIIVLALYV
jgi:hypothetical protein